LNYRPAIPITLNIQCILYLKYDFSTTKKAPNTEIKKTPTTNIQTTPKIDKKVVTKSASNVSISLRLLYFSLFYSPICINKAFFALLYGFAFACVINSIGA
jgi:hypothetical protein